MAAARRKGRQLRRHQWKLLDCGLRGALLLALLLLAAGMLIYSWSASSIFPGVPLDRRGSSRDDRSSELIGNGWIKEASVDISTRDLYDSIAFENKPGGAWTQGWPVKYKGDEWDRDKLNVFVVPHSHNDPGWIRTVEEYYQERSRLILSNIVRSLSYDPRRKFIWEEMSYLQRWWQDASGAEKKDLKRLLDNGQLEIVGGGWVMNDEANSHFFAIIEQMTAGNLWLKETLGVTPRNSWAIDPFGHSSTMAYLLKRMGFQNMLIQRTHYEVKKVLAQQQSLEFMWRQSWDSANTTDILCHLMPFYSYDIPHTCGPEPAVCCQFDYWRLVHVGGAQRCPWGLNPEEISERNVRERSMLLLDQYRKKSTLYKSNVLLVPLGDDFRYISSREAELQFENYQAIFDYINQHPELKANVQFGTLQDYFTALRSHTEIQFPSLSGDFFTYADRMQDYWSGYYVSRPFYKAVDRVLEETLRAADQLYFFTHSSCRPQHASAFPSSYAEAIVSARRNLALFQHHDGVTGTAKDHVVEDYGMRMHTSLLELQDFMAASVKILLSSRSGAEACEKNDSGLSYQPEQVRSKFNILPAKQTVKLAAGEVRRVVLYNPLEEPAEQVVTVMVDDPAVCVLDSGWSCLISQVSPEWIQGAGSGRHRLHWSAVVPALGLATFFVTTQSSSFCTKPASSATLRVFNSPSFSCPLGYSCTFEDSNIDEVEISNDLHTLGFDPSTGLLRRWRNGRSNRSVSVEEDVAYYSSRGSGAYLFLPDGEARSLVQSGGLLLVTQGALMQEVHAQFRSNLGTDHGPVTRSGRLFFTSKSSSVQAMSVEMVYNVELLDNKYNNKEIIARYKTGVRSNRVFYSDLNGFQTIRRQSYDKIPLQGNYYPMPSLAFVQDEDGGDRFSVHSRQALGVASLRDGELEMMLDRRLTEDDGRGLGQGVMDNRPLSVAFHLLLEQQNGAASPPSTSTIKLPSLLSHRVSAQLNYPLHAFLGKTAEDEASVTVEAWSPLVSPLPLDWHIVTLKALRPQTSSRRDYGIVFQRRAWDESYCSSSSISSNCNGVSRSGRVNLHSLFKNLGVGKVTPSTLSFLHDEEDDEFVRLSRKDVFNSARQASVELNPMEAQAYRFSVEPW